jgi:hypothetical protein
MTDDEVFDRLRAADPAHSLPPADPERVARLLEDAMTEDTQHETQHDTVTETRETGARDRGPLTWLVAAAAVVLIAVAGTFALVDLGDDPATPPAAGGDPSGAATPTVTLLSLPDAVAGRCIVPNAQLLSGAAYAVVAEVVSVTEGVVTLDATEWYAGEPTDQLEVAQSDGDLQALIGATEFENGQRYLVAGTDQGRVMVCGFTGPYTDQLAALYAQAFGS